MKGFGEEIAEDLRDTRRDEAIIRLHGASVASKPQREILILGAVGVVVLVIIGIALFPGCGNEVTTGDLPSIQVRLDLLESRLTRLEGMEDKIVFLDEQEKQLLDYVAETDKSGKYLAQRLDEVTQEVDRLEKATASVPARSEAPLTIQRIPLPLATGRYHEVHPGDTLYPIAQQYGTSV